MNSRYKVLNVLFAGISVSVAALCAAGCADDSPFGEKPGELPDRPVFGVSMSSSWQTGQDATRSGGTVSPLEGDSTGQTLYLVTEVAAVNDSVIGPATRGSKVENEEDFTKAYASFGLTGICHQRNGDSDVSDLAPNLLHNGKITKKGTFWEGQEPLYWPGSGRMRFFAYAPYATPDNGVSVSPSSQKGAPELTFKVNDDVEKQTDLLTSVRDVAGNGGGAINLEFRHALAAIQFKTGDAMLGGKVKKITLSGVYKEGKHRIGTAEWTATGDPLGSYEIEKVVEFDIKDKTPDSDPDHREDNHYTDNNQQYAGVDDNLTLFMIPQELPKGAKITMLFTDELTGLDRTLTADLAGLQWEAGKLYSYSLSTTGIVLNPVVKIVRCGTESFAFADSIPFTGVVRDVELTAYVEVTQAGMPTVRKGIPYTVECSTDGGKTWASKARWGDVWQPDKGASARAAETSDKSDVISSVRGTLYLPPQDLFASRQDEHFPGKLDDAEGSESNPKDLSSPESANCYMVGKPGYYKFRTVYGNSYNNPAAYTINRTGGDDHDPGMKWYVDHLDRRITNSSIKAQAGNLGKAFVLWQDSPSLVEDVRLSDDGDFISFYVDKHTIAQGNTVIALTDGSSDGNIVWSWHIWVTNQDWNSKTVTLKDEEGHTYEMAPSVLGRCDNSPGTPARNLQLRVRFDLKDANGNSITGTKVVSEGKEHDLLKEVGQKYMAASLGGDNTYYQWGRKDAMPGGRYGITNGRVGYPYYNYTEGNRAQEFTMMNKEIFDNPEKYQFAASESQSGASFGQTVSHPHRFVLGKGDYYRIHWHNEANVKEPYVETKVVNNVKIRGSMYNAWNTTAQKAYNNAKGNEYDDEGWNVGKSIYDPCPPGFHVPAAVTFSGMLNKSAGPDANNAEDSNQPMWDGSENCWRIKTDKSGSGEEIKIYATGVRDMNVPEGELKKNPFGPSGSLSSLNGLSWPAFSMIAYIATTSIGNNATAQNNILFFDHRKVNGDTEETLERCGWGLQSNNSYGFTIWPVKK